MPSTIVRAGVAKSGLPYVGMSVDVYGRLARHIADGKITAAMAAQATVVPFAGAGRNVLRVGEQNMINLFGLANLANKRNEIAQAFWTVHGVNREMYR